MDVQQAEDATRAAVALLRATLDGDEDGWDAIVDSLDVETARLVASCCAGMAVAGLRMQAESMGYDDPDEAVRGELVKFLTAVPQG